MIRKSSKAVLALRRQAKEDGARYARVGKNVPKEALANRTLAQFDDVPWPLRFVMYWDAFREGYLGTKVKPR